MSDLDFDVLVVGAGPAGATAGTLLAQAGFRVCVVERERFPRFHIGESLLPSCLPVLERIGVDLGARGYLRKDGAEFHDEATGQKQVYPFADAFDGPPRFAYQVERSQLDVDVIKAARTAGVEIRFGTTVVSAKHDAGGVELMLGETPQGPGPDDGDIEGRVHRSVAERADLPSLRGRYLIDASGRSGVSGTRPRKIMKIPGLGRGAVFTHVTNLRSPGFAELCATGNIRVLRIPHGWIWVIPMAGQKLSVGVVLREGKLTTELLSERIESSAMLQEIMGTGERGEVRRIGDYSYVNLEPYGERYVAIGDAAGFLDPVFSSGVALALAAAQRAVSLLVPALRENAEAEAGLMAPLSDMMAVAYRTFHVIAHRFYNTQMLDNVFFAGDPDPELRRGLISLLAGDVWRTDNPFAQLMFRASRPDLPAVPWLD